MTKRLHPTFEFGDFRIDLAKRRLTRKEGEAVPLRPRVFDTLLHLVEHSGKVLEKEELMAAIWPDQIVEENNLSQNISVLRRALGDNSAAPSYIMTVSGRGYRFLAEVRGDAGSEVALARGQPAPPDSPMRAMAVLPFKPVVPEQQNPVLEFGMADTLITKLGNNREIIVRPLSSVRKYAAPDQDPLVAGRALEVESVLDGEIQRSGDKIRVTARLLTVADGSSLWAGTFDEKFTDVFAVQDAISQKVVQALAVRLHGEEKKRLTKHGTENIAAYEQYLLGRYHWNRLTPPELAISIGYFQQATSLDGDFAQAYCGLAEAYRALAITGDVRPQETMPQAKTAAQRALEIDPSLADAHASLIFICNWFDWDWAGALKHAQQAFELNPNSGLARAGHAQTLSDLGRHDEAIAEAARARELDPVSLIINTIEGSILYFARRDAEAAARLQKTLELEPNFWIARLFLGKILMQKEKFAEALESFERARKFSHGNSETLGMIGYVLALSGETAKARAGLEELKALSAARYIPPHNMAVIHLGLGEREEAFASLETAFQDHDVRLSFLRVDPKWDAFRSDPRFGALLARLGL
ncbi:MAG: winged helix-turn-helix domain-containing protein [Chthoniobacterales bacterium]|nr:winged helix-turn-helix domain-containing protein [Chthoniobacterales bacterium]